MTFEEVDQPFRMYDYPCPLNLRSSSTKLAQTYDRVEVEEIVMSECLHGRESKLRGRDCGNQLQEASNASVRKAADFSVPAATGTL